MTAASRRGRTAPTAVLALLCTFASLAPAYAADDSTTTDAIAELRTEIEALRRAHEERIAALEARLTALESGTTAPLADAPTADAPSADEELARLRAAADAESGIATTTGAAAPVATPQSGDAELAAVLAAADAEAGTATVVAGIPTEGGNTGRGGGDLNQLNPEISFTGDFLGSTSTHGPDQFEAREFELAFQATLDPYSSTKWTIGFGSDGEIEVEEGYIAYSGVGHGLGLRAGRMRQTFGALNRWHAHALPQLDLPPVLSSYLGGEEGLAQTGLSAEWLMPHSLADASELTVQVTDGESEIFGGESFEHLAGLVHLKSYWDAGDATYLEWGLSGVGGSNGDGGDTAVLGTDFTWHWQPPSRAKYREVTWRSELLYSDRELEMDGINESREAWGGYSYVEALVHQNLYAGVRVDHVEDPLDPDSVLQGVFPYLTWWQSEYVRVRGELGFVDDDAVGETETRFTLQLTWAAGPHKHETY